MKYYVKQKSNLSKYISESVWCLLNFLKKIHTIILNHKKQPKSVSTDQITPPISRVVIFLIANTSSVMGTH